MEGPNQNKSQAIVFQALETARERRGHAPWRGSKQDGWVVVCTRHVWKVQLEEDFENHIKKFRLSLRDSRRPRRNFKEGTDIMRPAFQKDLDCISGDSLEMVVGSGGMEILGE